jgi:Zn-dependent M16 (insulinase) family peptidase
MGKITPSLLLSVIQDEIEESIIKHGQAKGPVGWKRPWIDTMSKEPPVITETKIHMVEFPEEDEGVGEVVWQFVGPEWQDFDTQKALDILSIYLTDSSVSPLYQNLVEIEKPYCTSLFDISTYFIGSC